MAAQVEPNLYAILGVNNVATSGQIKAAYYALAKTEHPDRKPDDPHATERFKEITRAYDVLKDSERRNHYDLYGTVKPQAGPYFTLDPGSRLWVWGLGFLLYIVFYTVSAYTDVALEWFIPIIGQVGLICFNRRLQHLDWMIWCGTFLLYFLPSILMRKLASYVFIIFSVVLINVTGVELDFSFLAVFLGFSWETWVRTAPTHWPILAAHTVLVCSFFALALTGFYGEIGVPVAESYILSNWNPYALITPAIFTVLHILDAIGGLVSPAFLVSYTMPLSWLIMTIFALLFLLLVIYARDWRHLGYYFACATVGYFVIGPYFPSKIVAFTVSISYMAFLVYVVNALQVALVTLKQIPSQSDVYYIFLGPACLLVDFLSGHYSSLGSAEWVRLGGILAALTPLLVFFCIRLPLIALDTANQSLQETQKQDEAAEVPTDEKDAASSNDGDVNHTKDHSNTE